MWGVGCVCVNRVCHTMAWMWSLEHNCGCWSLPSTSFDTQSLLFFCCVARLAGWPESSWYNHSVSAPISLNERWVDRCSCDVFSFYVSFVDLNSGPNTFVACAFIHWVTSQAPACQFLHTVLCEFSFLLMGMLYIHFTISGELTV